MDELDDEYLPSSILEAKTRFKGDAVKYVDNYFKKSILTDQARYNAFMDNPSLKVLEKDPGLPGSYGFPEAVSRYGGKMSSV